MRLPNADRATVETSKVRDYLLSPAHPVGRFKSRFFLSLGFGSEDWTELRDRLLEIGRVGEAEAGQPSPFGRKFEIRAIVTGPNGRSAAIVTVWMVALGRDFAHFVTAFPA